MWAMFSRNGDRYRIQRGSQQPVLITFYLRSAPKHPKLGLHPRPRDIISEGVKNLPVCAWNRIVCPRTQSQCFRENFLTRWKRETWSRPVQGWSVRGVFHPSQTEHLIPISTLWLTVQLFQQREVQLWWRWKFWAISLKEGATTERTRSTARRLIDTKIAERTENYVLMVWFSRCFFLQFAQD